VFIFIDCFDQCKCELRSDYREAARALRLSRYEHWRRRQRNRLL